MTGAPHNGVAFQIALQHRGFASDGHKLAFLAVLNEVRGGGCEVGWPRCVFLAQEAAGVTERVARRMMRHFAREGLLALTPATGSPSPRRAHDGVVTLNIEAIEALARRKGAA